MSIPIDDETYGGHGSTDPDEVKQGNPGRPQSDFDPDAPSAAPDPSPDAPLPDSEGPKGAIDDE